MSRNSLRRHQVSVQFRGEERDTFLRILFFDSSCEGNRKMLPTITPSYHTTVPY